MYYLYLILSLFFSTTVFAGLRSPSSTFVSCTTTQPGAVAIAIGGNYTGFQGATDCNIGCYNANNGSTTYNKSFYQAQNGTCGCSKAFSAPTEQAFGNAGNCAVGNYEADVITTSFYFQGCFAVKPAAVTLTSKPTGPNGCLTACATYGQAGFYGDASTVSSLAHPYFLMLTAFTHRTSTCINATVETVIMPIKRNAAPKHTL
jgi:hypothetical protein